MKKTLNSLAAATVFAGLVSIGVAFAAGLGAPDRGIPYVGQLQLDGADLTGDTTMSFSLWDDPVAGTELWTSGDVDVTVNGGRFAVVLGDGIGGALPDSVFDSAEVFVSVNVEGTALTGRQQIYAAAQAHGVDRAYSLTLADHAGAGRIYSSSQNGVVLYTDTGNAAADTQSALAVVANGPGGTGPEVVPLRLLQNGDLDVTGDISWGGDNSANGNIRLGNLQISWGTRDYNVTGLNTVATVGFGANAFIAPPAVTVSLDDPGFGFNNINDMVGARAITNTDFEILHKQDSLNTHPVTVQWMAIGRWQ